MNCIWCKDKVIIQTNWTTVLFPQKQSKLCKICASRFQVLKGERCEVCGRESEITLCHDCTRWKSMYDPERDPLIKNVSVFTYNTFMKEFMAQWKFRGDYILGEVFEHQFYETFRKYFRSIVKGAVIIPIPLSKTRLMERGFNQAEVLASFLTDQIDDQLIRVDHEKQSKKSRKERLETKNPFKLRSPIQKSVILVDDIYTTGRTLRHAAEVLIKNGCPAVYAYTLVRS